MSSYTASKSLYKSVFGAIALGLSVTSLSFNVQANGQITDQVNHLKDHLSEYSEEVSWLEEKYDGLVTRYEAKGTEAVDTQELINYWEEVNFHSAIETQYIPLYATIWQHIYGIKTGIENGDDAKKVRQHQRELTQTFWQALGAVKLAAHYQDKGVIDKIKTTDKAPTSAPEIITDIEKRLDKVVAKYAEQLTEVATTMVHDTYMERFEGIEGALIEQDASLVEALEKDFNVTLPQAIENGKSVDEVRSIVDTMKKKLDNAQSLLEKAEQNRKDVF
ncbi:hypothetical protein HHX48_11250 [Salinimonas sp. HHU 13199]|uniref:Orphan protein n=1 Tax=Salinimonas profundi TaxID=2729140 RepID=A0ABR8LJC8_9ALTE|nr:hypothetical protein [Salinimonas profundi]MBD3586315.1 hypothetical protein [Salinimonas profundi]